MKIIRPSDPASKEILENKLEQYQKRTRKILEDQQTGLAGSVETNRDYLDALCKQHVVRAVLERGELDTDTFRTEYEAKHGRVDDALFKNAITVIENYSLGRPGNFPGNMGSRL